ncbi:MAG: hypothetical protein NW224_04985 [Leptolyngbyaceae cyanobacterium bins.302]|nr:hypothetical protein [Leptolyngbyaceae cyanobacterium bins.302]
MTNLPQFSRWFSGVVMTSLMLPLTSLPIEAISPVVLESFLGRSELAQAPPQPRSKPVFWQRRKDPRTIRGMICTLAPGLIDTLNVWHDRPLFIWQGQGIQLRVRDYNQRDKILWEHPITAQAPLRYDGQDALQPGQLYQWQVVAPDPANSNRRVNQNNWETFRILPAEQRQTIATDLRTLEQRLQQQKASAEDIALSKAEFFADRELWSDALQVLYEVNNPSDQFVQQRSTYVTGLCKSPTP